MTRRGAAAVTAAVAAAVAALVWARRRLLIVRVDGVSMEPTYHDGDRILAVRPRRSGRLLAGDVVVFDPARPRVKRITALAGTVVDGAAVPAGCLYVRGDNGRSYDSAVHGPIAADLVFGRAVRRLARPDPDPASRTRLRPGPASVAGPGRSGG